MLDYICLPRFPRNPWKCQDGQRDRLNLNGTAGLYSDRGVVKPSQIEPVPRVSAREPLAGDP